MGILGEIGNPPWETMKHKLERIFLKIRCFMEYIWRSSRNKNDEIIFEEKSIEKLKTPGYNEITLFAPIKFHQNRNNPFGSKKIRMPNGEKMKH